MSHEERRRWVNQIASMNREINEANAKRIAAMEAARVRE
jgi:hypothetical protein